MLNTHGSFLFDDKALLEWGEVYENSDILKLVRGLLLMLFLHLLFAFQQVHSHFPSAQN